MNGFETAQLIKSRERTRFIPIIFLTAISKDEEYVFQGYSVGAVDYIFKPFQPAILRSKVQVFVELYRQQRRIAEQEQRCATSSGASSSCGTCASSCSRRRASARSSRTAMDAIIIFDDDGAITLLNGAAERMFGITANDVDRARRSTRFFPDGMSPDAIASSARRRQLRRAGRRIRSGRALMARRANGRDVPDRGVGVVPRHAGGERTFTLIVRDVSERVAHEDALQAAGRVARANRRRSSSSSTRSCTAGSSSSSAR